MVIAAVSVIYVYEPFTQHIRCKVVKATIIDLCAVQTHLLTPAENTLGLTNQAGQNGVK